MDMTRARLELPELNFLDFESASKAVLAFLHARIGFRLWMLTRTEGGGSIVLQAEDHGYGVTRGDVFSWTDTFCMPMVRGEGPRIAPDLEQVPAYAQAGIRRQLPSMAYIGVPLTNHDGKLFGTLCAIDPDPQSETIVMEQNLVELLAALLSSILKLELSATDAQRRSERLEMEAQIDSLTQLANRRAWDQLLAKEEERCLRYAHSAAIVVADLNGLKELNEQQGNIAGDDLIQRTADALRAATREVDVVARLGGDEFGVIAVECNDVGAKSLLKRIRQSLDEHKVAAAVGIAVRHPTGGLVKAWEQAELRMYEEKRARSQAV